MRSQWDALHPDQLDRDRAEKAEEDSPQLRLALGAEAGALQKDPKCTKVPQNYLKLLHLRKFLEEVIPVETINGPTIGKRQEAGRASLQLMNRSDTRFILVTLKEGRQVPNFIS
jgi:hypothetical protein